MLCSNLEMDLMCKPNITKVKLRQHFKPYVVLRIRM